MTHHDQMAENAQGDYCHDSTTDSMQPTTWPTGPLSIDSYSGLENVIPGIG